MAQPRVALSEIQMHELQETKAIVAEKLHLPTLSNADLVMMAVAKLKQEYEI